MKKDLKKSVEDEEKLEDMRRKYRHECKCGWLTVIYPFEKTDKKICKNCGRYVYINKESEFKDKLKGAMK